MSHFVGLVFVNNEEANVDMPLEPYCEEPEPEYEEWEDHTDEVKEEFEKLPEKEEGKEEKDYPKDKAHYPTIQDFARKWYGYEVRTDEDGNEIYGYMSNPNAKWDWYADGGRWDGYIYLKDGKEHNSLPIDEIDWVRMFTDVEYEYTDYDGKTKKGIDNHVPFCVVRTDGEWFEKGEMGWWCCVANEKPKDEWKEQVQSYVAQLLALPDEERENIEVYAIDFHI